MLREEGRSLDVRQEFEALLTTGRPSPTMTQFMLQRLGEQAVRRVWRTVRHSLCQVVMIANVQMRALLDQILFHLDDVRAFLCFEERFEKLNVSESALDNAIAAVADSCLRLSTFGAALDEIIARYERFWSFFLTKSGSGVSAMW